MPSWEVGVAAAAAKLRAMKEKSQIDAMRAAVRGDLERSRARQDTVPAVEPEPEEAPEQSAEDKPHPGFFSSLFKRG